MRESLAMLHAAPLRITVPLFGAVYRAPLASVLPADLTVWMEGPSGALKSSLVAVAQAHYGAEFDALHLPAEWRSTANQLERRAFVLKDTLFTIDDYAPSPMEARDYEVAASRLIRAQGNRSARGRLRSDLSERPAFPPRGLIVSTGEQHPAGQSLLARVFLVEVKPGDVNLEALTAMQHVVARLPHAMSAYITWLAPQMPTLAGTLRETFEKARERAAVEGHLRVPAAVAHLWVGVDLALAFAEEIGAISPAERKSLGDECWVALVDLGHRQRQAVDAERPTRRFLTVLSAIIRQGRAVLLERDGAGEHLGMSVDLMGWGDSEAFYLIPEAAHIAVSRACREAGEQFPVRLIRLLRDLADEGISVCDAGRHTTSARIGGRSQRVLKLRRKAVADLIGEDALPPVTTAATETTAARD